VASDNYRLRYICETGIHGDASPRIAQGKWPDDESRNRLVTHLELCYTLRGKTIHGILPGQHVGTYQQIHGDKHSEEMQTRSFCCCVGDEIRAVWGLPGGE